MTSHTIAARCRAALDGATEGPWTVSSRQDRNFQEHAIVQPNQGLYSICEMTDQDADSAPLVALAPEAAEEVVRLTAAAEALAEWHDTQAALTGDTTPVARQHRAAANALRSILNPESETP